MALKIKGISQLCFTEDGSYFHGNVITKQTQQYGLVGRICDVPEGQFHQCCFDDVPQFYEVRVIDHGSLDQDVEKDIVLKYVMRTGGDNCSLSSDDLTFNTDKLLVDSKAEDYIKKYFSEKLLNRNCYVCIGNIDIDHKPK